MAIEKNYTRKYSDFRGYIRGMTQAGGAEVLDTGQSLPFRNWQIQFVPSATPATGTAAVQVKTPGARGRVTLATTVDLTSDNLLVSFTAAAEDIRIAPSNLDGDKVLDVYFFAT